MATLGHDYSRTAGAVSSDTRYTNADLDAAESRLVAAGRGDEAAALRQYTEGIRNLVQGVWGQSFVLSLETMIERQSATIAAAVASAVRLEVAAALSPFQQDLAELRAQFDALSTAAQARYSGIESAQAQARIDLATLTTHVDHLDAIKRQRLDSIEAKVDRLAERTIAEELTAAERRELTGNLRKLTAILPDLETMVAERRARSDGN